MERSQDDVLDTGGLVAGGPGGHSQCAIETQGDLSHARPSWAAFSLTEGDLIFGHGMSPVATLVERSTRYLMLVGLPDGHRAELVADALAAAITTLRGS